MNFQGFLLGAHKEKALGGGGDSLTVWLGQALHEVAFTRDPAGYCVGHAGRRARSRPRRPFCRTKWMPVQQYYGEVQLNSRHEGC